MSDPQAIGGFGESPQAPFELGNIPTDPEAFLHWNSSLDRHHSYKYELSNGKVSRTVINVSKAHWRVTANTLRELFQKVDRSKFEAGPTELGVRTGTGVRCPEVVVDRASSRVEGLLACEAPVLIVEVLSASTVGLDFTVKLREYRTINSVQAYLICSQDEPRARIWQREEDGTWPELPTELVGREGRSSSGRSGSSSRWTHYSTLSRIRRPFRCPAHPATAIPAKAGTQHTTRRGTPDRNTMPRRRGS